MNAGQRRRWANVALVTAFVLVTVAVSGFIAANIVGFEWGTERYTLSASFGDIAGLREGDPVKLAGVAVGDVREVDVDEGRAVVHFTVDDTVRLPANSEVSVRWLNLIGQRYLSLRPGTGHGTLDDGDTVERAGNVVDLSELVNQLAPLATSVSPDDLNRILHALLSAFEGNDAAFDGLLADLDTVLGSLAARQDTIDQMVLDYETVTSAIATRDEQIASMVSNLVAISETFADNDDLLETALDELSTFSAGLDQLLSTGADDFGAVLEHLAVLLDTTAANADELERSLQNLPGLFDALLPVINRGEWVRVNVLCFTVAPGQCPHPMSLGEERVG